ncbi:MAG: hypothetical protein NXI20_25060 [bacterium]|nr:hypothetical protein [bacterium]
MDSKYLVITQNNIRFSAYYSKSAKELTEEHFLLEYNSFKYISNLCPQTINEFLDYYDGKHLNVFDLKKEDRLIGYRICESISSNHVHNSIIVIDNQYRNKNLGTFLTLHSNYFLKNIGINIITEFSIEPQISIKLNKPFSPIGISEKLTEIEKNILTDLSENRKISYGDGNSRLIKNYYKTGGNNKHATFLVFDTHVT